MAQYKNQIISDLSDVTDWQTWSPTYDGITVGNGSVTARYMQIGKTVWCRFSLIMGSTSTVSTTGTITMPITMADVSYINNESVFGPCSFRDSSGGRYMGDIRRSNNTTFRPFSYQHDVTFLAVGTIGTTVPFTWATGDILTFQATYEAA